MSKAHGRTPLALLLVVVVLASLAQVLPVRAAERTPGRAVSPRRLPLPPVQASAAGGAAHRRAGDFAPLLGRRASSGYDPRRSRLVGRSQFAELFANPDGTRTARLSSEPLSVRDQQGRWQPVQLGLSTDPGSGRIRTGQHPLRPSFAPRADDPALVEAATPSGAVRLALESAAAQPASAKGGVVRYTDVLADTDLTYQPTNSAVKETLVVRKAPAAGSWRFRLRTAGLSPALDRSGAVLLRNAVGGTEAMLPPLMVWDSSGGRERAPAWGPGRYELARSGRDWVVRVLVDDAWLADPARVYPVYVDPSIAPGLLSSQTYRTDGYTCGNCGLQIGNSLHAGDSYSRTVFGISLAPLAGKTVVGAQLDVWREPGSTGTDTNRPANLWHATAWSFNGVGEWLAGTTLGPPRRSATMR